MKHFDFKLYKEGLRQLTLAGVVCSAILIVEGILLPLLNLITVYDSTRRTVTSLLIDSVNPLLAAVPYAVTILMVLILFRFLNSRSGSDMYHSIPQTRVCLAVSFLAAAVTWVLGILWGCSIFTAVFTEILPTSTVLWGESMRILLRQTAACLLAVSGTFLAVSVTGTVFTNLAATAMVLFMPALLEIVVELNVENHFIWVSSLRNLFPYNYNTLISGYRDVGVILGIEVSNSGLLASLLYTLLMAAAVGALGLYMFHRRKSESAGQAASNRKLKALFRVIPAYAFTLIPVSMLFWIGFTDLDGEDGFLIVIFFIMAIIIYLLYELFSTGKWRNVIRSIKGLWLLAVIDAVTLIVMYAMTAYIRNDVPEASDIDSVYLSSSGYGSYYDTQLSGVKLSGDDLGELIADSLKDTIEYWENGKTYYGEYSHEVVIRSGWKVLYRKIRLDAVREKKLRSLLEQSEEYRNALMTLPDLDTWNLSLLQDTDIDLTEEQAEAIHATLQKEIEEMGYWKWTDLIGEDYYYSHWFNLFYESTIGQGRLTIGVNRETMPETFKKCLECITFNEDTDPQMIECLGKIAEGKADYADIQIRLINLKSGEEEMNEWFSYYREDGQEYMSKEEETYLAEEQAVCENAAEKLKDILQNSSADAADYILNVSLNAQDGAGYGEYWELSNYRLSKEHAQELLSLRQVY